MYLWRFLRVVVFVVVLLAFYLGNELEAKSIDSHVRLVGRCVISEDFGKYVTDFRKGLVCKRALGFMEYVDVYQVNKVMVDVMVKDKFPDIIIGPMGLYLDNKNYKAMSSLICVVTKGYEVKYFIVYVRSKLVNSIPVKSVRKALAPVCVNLRDIK